MPTAPTKTAKPLSAPQKALRKMGLVRDVDLALHLPYRYEDETRLTRLADAREGETVQFEATVRSCEVVFKPRRQLLAVVEDGGETCTLRFFNFYPACKKPWKWGDRCACAARCAVDSWGAPACIPACKLRVAICPPP